MIAVMMKNLIIRYFGKDEEEIRLDRDQNKKEEAEMNEEEIDEKNKKMEEEDMDQDDLESYDEGCLYRLATTAEKHSDATKKIKIKDFNSFFSY